MDLLVERRGHGPALVLLPGFGARGAIWEPVLDELSRRHEVVAVNLPGFGSPSPPGAVSSVESLTDAVGGWLAEHGYRRPHMAGNSLGGAIALELARRGRAASVCAIAPIGFWGAGTAWLSGMQFKVGYSLARVVRRWLPRLLRPTVMRSLILAPYFGRPGHLSYDQALALSLSFAEAGRAARAMPLTRRYRFAGGSTITVPVTIAWGMRDRILPRWQGRRAANAIAGAKLVWLPGCGHVPMADDPRVVAGTILGTVRRADTAGMLREGAPG